MPWPIIVAVSAAIKTAVMMGVPVSGDAARGAIAALKAVKFQSERRSMNRCLAFLKQ